MLKILRRSVLAAGALLLSFAILVAVQVLIAWRVERLEPFPREAIDRAEGEGERLRMVWLGDSTSVGVGASSPEQALPVQVADGLGVGYDLSVLGVSGGKTEDALRDQLPQVSALEPDWIFVAIGNNDVTAVTSRSTFRDRYADLLEGVQQVGADQVIVLGIAEFGGTPLLARPLRNIVGWRARQLDRIVRDLANRRGLIYVPIADLTREGFAEDPEGTHADDRFHPSDAGYELWARAVLDTLREAGFPRSEGP